MHFKTLKDAYLYGVKDGMIMGIEKGLEIAESWTECADCPPNTAPLMVESTTHMASDTE